MKTAVSFLLGAGALVAAALPLSGCAMPSLGSTFSGGIFGSKKSENAWTPVTEEALLTAAKNDTGDRRGGETEIGCPTFSVWGPDKVLTIYEAGHTNDSMFVIHRGEITKTARECSGEDRIAVKYGLGGRVLLGPRGKPGPVLLPVVINVYDPARNLVKSTRARIETDVGADEPAAYFSLVDTIEFPLAPGTSQKDYKIFVSFDQNGGAIRAPAVAGQKPRR